MNRFSIAVVTAVSAVVLAQGAAAQAPTYNWTGFYAGLNAGGSFGHDPTTEIDATLGLTLGTPTLSPTGFVGGGQLGYNYQFAPHWVAGIEGDFQGTTQHDSNCTGRGCTVPGDFYFTDEQKLKWFATLRGRLGYAYENWLFYVTGGGAWGQINNDFRVFVPTDAAFNANFNLSGYVVGGGAEVHLRDRWSVKFEYLYLDLGSFTDGGVDPLTGDTFLMPSDVHDHIVRLGLNYKFY